MVTAANLTGRALARNGALTLDTNDITPPSGTCKVDASTSSAAGSGSTVGSGTTVGSGSTTDASTPGTGSAVPDSLLLPGLLLLIGGGGMIAVEIRRGYRAR
jgi:hypothetical protein